jgi:hypothetical protein
VHDLEETLPGLLFAHVAAGDVLHEDGEVLAEPWALFAEERRLGDAAGVDRAAAQQLLSICTFLPVNQVN